jgi:hypothetical protein
MKKTLVYHLYVSDDFDTNMCYKVHFECLKQFIDVFDKVKFTICVDDLSNTVLIKKGIDWIFNLGLKCEVEINTSINSLYRESSTLYNKILKSDDDELYFFFHSKGTTNFVDTTKSIDSVFIWICGIYYYSLHSDYDAVKILEGTYRTMCGPFLLTPPLNGTGNFFQFYAGGGYWINNASLKNLRKIKAIPELTVSDRYFSEKYPGMVLSTYEDYGLEGVNTTMVILGRIDGTSFYNGSAEDWNYIISLYQYPEKFIEFVNNIGNKVGFKPFNE